MKKRILVFSGSRADYGLLEWPIKVLQEDGAFEVDVVKRWGLALDEAAQEAYAFKRPDLLLVLGDRFEVLGVVTVAHLARIPIAHIGGGDVTEGSYDDAMRDCISRMASIHFVTSTSAMARLAHMGLRNVHLVGNPGIDYIRNADWRRERPYAEPYVVVSYQPETIDAGHNFTLLHATLPDCKRVYIAPNQDRGSEYIKRDILRLKRSNDSVYESLPHGDFLNLLAHCDEFIGNSSAMLYEAPELGIKTRMIGKRQRGRTIPWGDGNASKRIATILKYTMP